MSLLQLAELESKVEGGPRQTFLSLVSPTHKHVDIPCRYILELSLTSQGLGDAPIEGLAPPGTECLGSG